LQVDGTPRASWLLGANQGIVAPMRPPRSLFLSALAIAAAGVLPTSASADGRLVRPGETLSGIAAANNVTTAALAAANGMSPTAFVIAGTTLRIPATSAGTANSATAARHLVRVGETLSGIAAANGLSTKTLADANGLTPTSFVIAGTTLRIPGSTAVVTTTPAPLGGYRVRVGDTLTGVAARLGVTPAALAATNELDPKGILLAGTSLRLPGPGVRPALALAPSAMSGGPQAVGGRLSGAQISSIASQYGAPGDLAAAIAWQESGFNNSMISPANARGIMQVIPSSWDYVQTFLARERLDTASPTDNVKAGSLLLANLLRRTGGNTETAVAAYYQGLGSVSRIGMLPETRKYVDNVLALRSRFAS
jgi:LysM repeat protein